VAKTKYADDNKTYFIPSRVLDKAGTIPTFNGSHSAYARYDIYQAIGSPKISSEDDFLNVLKQMQEYQQTKIGDSGKVYAFSMNIDWGLMEPYSQSYSAGVWNSFYSDNPLGIRNVDTFEREKLGAVSPDSKFWDQWKYFNKAWRMGLLDPESFTQKFDQVIAKVNKGLVISSFTGFAPDPKLNGELAGFYVLPGVYAMDRLVSRAQPAGTTWESRCIATTCKYPERAMQWLDYLASDEGSRIAVNGPKGIDWDVVDGKPQLIGEALAAQKAGGDALIAYNTKTKRNPSSMLSDLVGSGTSNISGDDG
jgi:hypothetical protein